MTYSALLVLQDGSLFYGRAIGASGITVGEVVFNTAMTGYQEILSDPSYSQQIVTLTSPHIGNVGINAVDQESDSIHVSGLVIRDLPLLVSNYRSQEDLSSYLCRHQVVAIAEVDTRQLTRILRQKGSLTGCIIAGQALDVALAEQRLTEFAGIAGSDLAKLVTTKQRYQWQQGTVPISASDAVAASAKPASDYHLVVYDYGVKQTILRMLVDRGCRLTVVPADTEAAEVLQLTPDGVFFSNGPGDPAACHYALPIIQQLLAAELPLLGICLGHQLLALASGARTVKMPFGHHGANHPVQDLASGQVWITSQNHGFAVDEQHLPDCLQVTHRSLFDGSIQGIARRDKPALSFQGHPEASPGPHDASPLFDRFIALMQQRQRSTASHCLTIEE